jgi:hypothetical protein
MEGPPLPFLLGPRPATAMDVNLHQRSEYEDQLEGLVTRAADVEGKLGGRFVRGAYQWIITRSR